MGPTRPLHAVFLRHPAPLRSNLVWQCSRSYHSYEHEAPPPFTPTEDAILSAALAHVPTHGFTNTALTQGARDAGYLDVSTNLFPAGAFSIVKYHLVTQRLALARHASSLQSQSDITTKIRKLALHRLHANEPIVHHWQEALALLSTARHLPTSLRELALLSDELLFLAGSTTVTSAWYTNRAALAAIYASAELFMTQDKSKGFTETEKFLKRRLEEGEKIRGGLDMVGKWVGMQAGGLVDGLRSKGVWI
ncbi:Ubiquinone biosynthesis protein coq9, mitochondrial [Imshaugia aleurites]|uniref:Ubiquinone biosynthesis protein n=1 Tax=Imshaugia aleurites TaxID=172621 RepID=A0A8H3EH70_9LECA|nr:Ubiquinone biosynthesis protein coq9, mitochondrial [Imshaugia aleurites]